MNLDIPISWTLSVLACWPIALLGLPVNAQIAAALMAQVLWLAYRSF